MAFLTKFGQPLQPFQRLHREIHGYQTQSHSEHLDNLRKYLLIAPYLTPKDYDTLIRPVIRHPDLQPHNVFVSDKFDIVGLRDWQHCSILPLFLQAGIPNSFQNYGDSVSDVLQPPELPKEFDHLSEREQVEQLELLRRRQLHYFYVADTATLNKIHYDALTYNFSMLIRKLFHHASDRWEGDNVTLKADLIQLVRNWSDIATGPDGHCPPCPISFREDEMNECLRLHAAQAEADAQLDMCRNIIGVGPEGWVPVDQYEEAKERSDKLKADTLEEAESDVEKARILEHWPFDDQDEESYS